MTISNVITTASLMESLQTAVVREDVLGLMSSATLLHDVTSELSEKETFLNTIVSPLHAYVEELLRLRADEACLYERQIGRIMMETERRLIFLSMLYITYPDTVLNIWKTIMSPQDTQEVLALVSPDVKIHLSSLLVMAYGEMDSFLDVLMEMAFLKAEELDIV